MAQANGYWLQDSKGNKLTWASSKKEAKERQSYERRIYGKKWRIVKATKSNPSISKGKWIKAKAVKINRNGSISIKK